jgi:MFS family permease
VPDWLRQTQTYGIFMAGYLARPLGGIIMAHFGDRQGRKRMFALSVLLMAAPTLAIGLLPTYVSVGAAAPLALLLLRMVQGAAIGGEVPGAWVFVAEHLPDRVGLACGTLTAGLTLGILLGSLVAGGLHRSLSPADLLDWGWRLAFLLGGVFGLVAVWLRTWLRETPLFEALASERQLSKKAPISLVLQHHRGAVLHAMGLTWMLTAAIVVVILMTPAMLKGWNIAPATALAANSVGTIGLTLGCLGFGLLADRLGASRVLLVGGLALAAAVECFYQSVHADHALLMPLYGLTGLACGVVAVVPVLMVRSFPTAVRFSGLSFAYNAAYAIAGGLTPPLVGWLGHLDPLGPGHYVSALAIIGAGLAGLTLLRHPGRPAHLEPDAAVLR